MKILILSNSLESTGGIQNFTKDLYSSLSIESPFECKIYLIDKCLGRFSLLFSTFRSILHFKPDLIVLPHINLLPLALCFKYLFRFKVVTCLHGIEIPIFARKPLSILYASLSDAFFSVSSWTDLLALEHLRLDKNKLFRQYNTFRESVFRFIPDSDIPFLRSKYNLTTSHNVLITVCRFDPSESYKGYDQIIELIPDILLKFPNFIYLLVGDGDDLPRLKSKVDAYGIKEHVVFLGRVSDEHLSELYSLSDVFAMPSSSEGFGIVFLEALACGTPILAGNKDGSVEPALNGFLGRLVDPTDPVDILHGLLNLLGKNGPDFWFDRNLLRYQCISHFSYNNFKLNVRKNINSL